MVTRLITGVLKYHQLTLMLQDLHCLPCTQYKILIIHCLAPDYINDKLTLHKPFCTLLLVWQVRRNGKKDRGLCASKTKRSATISWPGADKKILVYKPSRWPETALLECSKLHVSGSTWQILGGGWTYLYPPHFFHWGLSPPPVLPPLLSGDSLICHYKNKCR